MNSRRRGMGRMIGGAALWIFSACASGENNNGSLATVPNPTAAADTTTGSSTDTTGTSSTSDDSSTASVELTTSAEDSTSSTTAPSLGCGNGMLDPFEVCDDGNDIDGDACTNTCNDAVCGDGVVYEGVETCDDTGVSATCDADCSAVMCGDMLVNAAAGETCDDGNVINGDGCEADCQPTMGPPECLNAVQLTDAARNVSNLAGPVGCDSDLLPQWYRFTGAAGVKMPNTPPPVSACGTDAPGWIDGVDPTVDEGAVPRTVCFNFGANVCNWNEPAMVRNCGDYYVYLLSPPSWGCNGRYCGTD